MGFPVGHVSIFQVPQFLLGLLYSELPSSDYGSFVMMPGLHFDILDNLYTVKNELLVTPKRSYFQSENKELPQLLESPQLPILTV